MRFTSINSAISITNDEVVKSINNNCNDKIFPLEISAYIEEESHSRSITLNISPDIDIEGFDIWLDLDIYQAELLSIKLKELVKNRKLFLKNKMNEL